MIMKKLEEARCLLERRSTVSIAASLGALSSLWLKRNYSFRKKAVRHLVAKSNFTEKKAKMLLDSLFKELTYARLIKLLKSEFRDMRVLDGFRPDATSGVRHRARGPRLIMHIFAGNVPNPSIISFILGMLLKSANVGKPSSSDDGFLNIYLDSLRKFDKGLAAPQRLIRPKDRALLRSLIQESELVVAYGTNESLRKIRKEVPPNVPFVGYGHRVSFAFFAKEILRKNKVRFLARRAARDIWMMDTRGCLSPERLYAEAGGEVSLREFAEHVLRALEKLDYSSERLYHLKNWLKLSQLQAEFFEDLQAAGKTLQCVALEVGPQRKERILEKLSELGVNRICRAGAMQAPPLTWHHDGRFNLASWVTWTDDET